MVVVKRMLAAPRSALGSVRRVPRHTPLRVRLVAAMLLLVIAALAISGLLARSTLRSYQITRVDAQLKSAAHPAQEHGVGTLGNQGDGGTNGLFSNFVTEVTDANGKIRVPLSQNLVDPKQPLPQLPKFTGAQITTAGAHYLTVDAVHGGDHWRVLAVPIALSDGSTGTLLVAQNLDEVDNTVSQLTVLLLIIGAACVVVVGGLGYLIVRTSLRPLREVERTAAKIAAGDLSERVPHADARTEVGQLSGALNTMLAEVETAFAQRADSEAAARQSEERMRRFVADASHELRTPLTSIRGFAELYRQGAVHGEADVHRVMGRIEDEAKRMGLLVEDLLLLARLDQERPFARAPVDLLALVGDAVHDARAVAPDRPITLEVGVTDPPPVVIGDEARLRQVLGNLVSNALRHTPPTTSVHVGVGSAGDERTGAQIVELVVADDGPGMSEEQAARVFERFYRADAARNRNDGGTGLGLAIVSALVAGHGGTVDVSTAPGSGARFTVTLPLATAPAQPVGAHR
jgi:two-component system OmpR family sensor kinase